MTQRRSASLVEAATNAIVGLVVSVLFTYFCLPFFGLRPSIIDASAIAGCYFVLSVVRAYVLRRAFEAIR